jgi:hypothetical protein
MVVVVGGGGGECEMMFFFFHFGSNLSSLYALWKLMLREESIFIRAEDIFRAASPFVECSLRIACMSTQGALDERTKHT